MAKTRSQRGGTLLGFLAGLVLGLGIAVVVALFVTRAPVPFVKKSHRAPETVTAPEAGAPLPDPNAPLLGRQPAPEGGTAPGGAPAAAPSQATPQPPAAGAPAGSAPATADGGYLLQVAAFRSVDDAEGMKARLALLGFEARVVQAEVNGQTMHRVRIGPFATQEEANRARARLIDGGFESSVVRQR
ncbi:SPOR domain-containing protein [Burkholderiaceae bacterium FT117]|uniref:SPOR domain-containing protein n=1 Tax=Zeimonas sediminis TaxID=2944268 RepID=UPI002342D1C1|nr:SPOR domain-containing protein [Zeimonas sediminis]MCM5570995.1 SPOR domain-containing protein [Zeimonas sediminis]